MKRILFLCSAAAIATVATAAVADSFIFRRALQNPLVTISPPGDDAGAENGEDEFNPGPLRAGGVLLGSGSHSETKIVNPNYFLWERSTVFFGLLASGGHPPYTISATGAGAASAIKYYRRENFYPDTFRSTQDCGMAPEDPLCLFPVSGSSSSMIAGGPAAAVYTTDDLYKFRYAELASDCDVDVSGSKHIRDTYSRWLSEDHGEGSEVSRSRVEYSHGSTACGGYDQQSIVGAVELGLSGYVETAPGDYSYTFTVTDADGQSASTDATIRINPVPIRFAEEERTVSEGKSYAAADKLIDLRGGFGSVSLAYSSEVRVPGLDLVNGKLVGTPTESGNWTLSFLARDEAGQETTLALGVDVTVNCGDPVIFSTSGTFTYTPPTGCTRLFAEAWGGGAKGITGSPNITGNGGAGGGGGAYASVTFGVTAASYKVTVGGAEKDSSVMDGSTILLLAKAGYGSSGGSKNQSVGDVTSGGGGGRIGRIMAAGEGGKGGGPDGGAGGEPRYGMTNGTAPGGGGSGGDAGGKAGGAGAVGRVIVQALP